MQHAVCSMQHAARLTRSLAGRTLAARVHAAHPELDRDGGGREVVELGQDQDLRPEGRSAAAGSDGFVRDRLPAVQFLTDEKSIKVS